MGGGPWGRNRSRLGPWCLGTATQGHGTAGRASCEITLSESWGAWGVCDHSQSCLVTCRSLSARSVVSQALWSQRLQPARLLCPWDSPGKNTGVGYHALLQGIFPTQGSNPLLLGLLPGSSPQAPAGKPRIASIVTSKTHEPLHSFILFPMSFCELEWFVKEQKVGLWFN